MDSGHEIFKVNIVLQKNSLRTFLDECSVYVLQCRWIFFGTNIPNIAIVPPVIAPLNPYPTKNECHHIVKTTPATLGHFFLPQHNPPNSQINPTFLITRKCPPYRSPEDKLHSTLSYLSTWTAECVDISSCLFFLHLSPVQAFTFHQVGTKQD